MQGRNRDTDIEYKLVDPAGEGEGRTNRESSTDIYTLSCVRQIASGKLLCSTGSPTWCSVMTQRGEMGWEETHEGGVVRILYN